MAMRRGPRRQSAVGDLSCLFTAGVLLQFCLFALTLSRWKGGRHEPTGGFKSALLRQSLGAAPASLVAPAPRGVGRPPRRDRGGDALPETAEDEEARLTALEERIAREAGAVARARRQRAQFAEAEAALQAFRENAEHQGRGGGKEAPPARGREEGGGAEKLEAAKQNLVALADQMEREQQRSLAQGGNGAEAERLEAAKQDLVALADRMEREQLRSLAREDGDEGREEEEEEERRREELEAAQREGEEEARLVAEEQRAARTERKEEAPPRRSDPRRKEGAGLGDDPPARKWEEFAAIAPAALRPPPLKGVEPPSSSTKKECRCVNCEEDRLCGGLWKGFRRPSGGGTRAVKAGSVQQVHVVVSHCRSRLDWLEGYMRPAAPAERYNLKDRRGWWEAYIRPPRTSSPAYRIASLHVISKCDPQDDTGAPAGATVETLPNVGRCDHSYAHYIASRPVRDRLGLDREGGDAADEAPSPVVVFLKDDVSRKNMHQGHARRNTFPEMVALAVANGFACGITPTRWSAFHDKKTFLGFHLERYERNLKDYDVDGAAFRSDIYKNVGEYFRHITSFNVEDRSAPHSYPNLPDVVQVCYGGVFAVTADRLRRVPTHVPHNIMRTLSRGDNIQEGHYAERSWAMLLAQPLEPYEEGPVRAWATGGTRPHSVLGALFHKKEPEKEEKAANGVGESRRAHGVHPRRPDPRSPRIVRR